MVIIVVGVDVGKREILGFPVQSWMFTYVFCDSFRLVMIPKSRILTKRHLFLAETRGFGARLKHLEKSPPGRCSPT